MDELLQAERDAIAALGLLARAFLMFDVPIELGDQSAPTHLHGLNVHCLIVDNEDGEVLAADNNQIHATENPLNHAEQRAVRTAIDRIRLKRPRLATRTVEDYYKHSMFMAPGSRMTDYLRTGCTLYNTFDPCAMCAVTLLIAYMKRVAYVFEDHVFAGFFVKTKEQYFKSRESMHGRVYLGAHDTKLTMGVKSLLDVLDRRINELLGKHVSLINVLDYSREQLAGAVPLLQRLSVDDLVTEGKDLARNTRTLADVKRLCNLPL